MEDQLKELQDRIEKLEIGKITQPKLSASEAEKQKKALVTAAVKKFAANQNAILKNTKNQ